MHVSTVKIDLYIPARVLVGTPGYLKCTRAGRMPALRSAGLTKFLDNPQAALRNCCRT